MMHAETAGASKTKKLSAEINRIITNKLVLHNLLFLDIFAGCARLSEAMKTKTFQVLPVDAKNNRHTPVVRTVELDLAKRDHQNILLDVVETEPVAGANLGPPCGTSSRAREKPLPAWQIKRGVPQPKPLRDADNLLGLPGLSETDLARVTTANELYLFCVKFALACIRKQIPFFYRKPKALMGLGSYEVLCKATWT